MVTSLDVLIEVVPRISAGSVTRAITGTRQTCQLHTHTHTHTHTYGYNTKTGVQDNSLEKVHEVKRVIKEFFSLALRVLIPQFSYMI